MKTENNRILIMRILEFYKPFRSRIAFICLCMLLCAVIHMLNPIIGKLLIDNGFLQKNVGTTIKFVVLGFVLLLVQQVIEIFQTRLLAHLHAKTAFYMNKSALEHLLKAKIEFFKNANFSEILNNVNSDIRNINRISEKNTFNVLTEILKLLGGTVALIVIDFRLTCLILVTIPIRYAIIKHLAGKKEAGFEVYMDVNRKYHSWYGDTIGGIREIKLLGIDKVIKSQFINHQRNIIKADINIAVLDVYNNISETMLHNTLVSVLYIIGAYFISNSSMSLGSLFAFITYSSYVTQPISAIMNIRYELASIIPAAKRFFNFLDVKCEKDDNPKKAVPTSNKNMKGHIVFKSVAFSYTKEMDVLKNISFEIKPGEKVAIIGHNGSGKSTIINLLQKLYRPEAGVILIDGIDIQSIKSREYRKLISFVDQDTYLFNTSIRNNITLFSDVEDSHLYKAAQLCCVHEFIEKLPEKYESKTGRNGLLLSSGQKQKIAIARAFLRDSKILVFDEATSNCDADSESQINTIIKDNMEDKTVIIITHKPNILQIVDRVFLVQNGVIKETGSCKAASEVLETDYSGTRLRNDAV